MAKSWPNPRYEVRVTFQAPLDFVYQWCTDYTPSDAKYEGDDYERRILRKSKSEVTYEDLSEAKDGWFWARHVVRLHPPNRWHSESIGSHRQYSLDYRLKRLAANRTELTLTARRRPYGIGGKNPAKAGWESSVAKSWSNFSRVLERDYRKTSSKK
jgi:hypothetical protein